MNRFLHYFWKQKSTLHCSIFALIFKFWLFNQDESFIGKNTPLNQPSRKCMIDSRAETVQVTTLPSSRRSYSTLLESENVTFAYVEAL